MVTQYYNYRPIDLDTAQKLYPDWRVGAMLKHTDDGRLVDDPDYFTIGCPIGSVYDNPELCLNACLDGHLLIELGTHHWFEYEAPLNKFQRGPYAGADVGYDAHPEDMALNLMGTALNNGRVKLGRETWREPVGFLPVTLWVANQKLSHLVEAQPYQATHVLYYYDCKIIRSYSQRFDDFFGGEMLVCYVGYGASFVLAELSLPAGLLSKKNEDLLGQTNFRASMERAQAAFQRKVGPTCPSTVMTRLHGALDEYGII